MMVSALKKLLWVALSCLIAILLIACITFYYLTGTTHGSRALLEKSREYLRDYVEIEAEITEGSLLFGFKSDKPISVVVPEVVTITSDSLDLNYNVFDLITKNVLVIDLLSIPNLKVNLLISSQGPEDESDTEEFDDESFRLNFPVPIVIKELRSTDFAYLSDIVDVRIKNIDLSLEARDDLASVTGGTVDKVTVQLHDEILDDEEDDDKTVHVMTFDGGGNAGAELIEKLGPIPLPLNASISNLKIKNGRYFMTVYDSGLFDADVSAFWSGTLLQVSQVHADSHELGEVWVSGTLDFVDYFNFDFKVRGIGKRNQYTSSQYEGALYALNGEGTLTGNLTDLSFAATISQPQRFAVKSRINTLSDDLPCELRLTAQSLRYPLLYAAASATDTVPETTEVTFDSWQKTSDMSQIMSLNSNGAKIDYLSEEQKEIKAQVEGLYLSSSGSIINGMDTVMSGKFTGYGLEHTNVLLEGCLGLLHSEIKKLSADGEYEKTRFVTSFAGRVDYEDELSTEGSVLFESPDLGALHNELKGRFVSQLDFKSAYEQKKGLISFTIDELNSTFLLKNTKASLEGRKISGTLLDNGEDPQISIEKLTLSHKDNYLDLSGNLSENSSLNAVLKFDDLSAFAQELSGQFNAHMMITGSHKSPAIELVGTSKYLAIDKVSALNLAVNSTFNLKQEKVSVAVIADSVKLSPELKASRKCAFDLSGTLLAHRLSLNCGGNNGGFISTEGSYDRNTGLLKGQIKDLLFVSEFSDPVSLKKAVEFRIDTLTDTESDELSGSIEAFELTSKQFGQLTVAKTVFAGDSLHTSMKIDDLPLKGFARYLPEDSHLEGTVAVSAQLDIEAGTPSLKGALSSSSGHLYLPEFRFAYQSVKLETEFDNSEAKAALTVALPGDNGSLATNISIKDPTGSRVLAGNIQVKELDLDLFDALSSNFNELYGKANISGTLSGSLNQPLFNGKITVKGKAEPYYDVGSVNGFDLTVDARGANGQLSGKVKLNEGVLNFGGDLDWSDSAKANISLDADNLPVFLLGYGVAYTNVHTRAVLDKSLDISGRIDIPSASIVVEGLNSSVTYPSSDEIIVGKNGSSALIREKARKKSSLETSINVDVNLGSKVNLRAMGLRAQVVGGIKIRKKISEDGINGYGTVSLEHGVADLYGHHFLVNYANTFFNGNIAHPKLGAEIIADPSGLDNNVIVGVKVLGDVADPHIELFSKPSMSENEIISYLIYGHGLDKSSGDASAGGAELLMALGLGTTTGMINSVATAFGMHSVQVGSKGTGDETQFGIQGYLTKDIRISYGYGLFTSVGEFSLRYELMRRLYIEFASSIGQAVDLIYSFEFD
ncbi:MAG: translocation/assembly module TamB domain-containing protein [Succinivibrio sp.]|nr:translocation/assembly module TamB domain-containing protein [Succinivibrio sp.]